MRFPLDYWKSHFSAGFVLAFHDIRAERLAQLVDALPPRQIVHLSELVQRTRNGRSTAGLFAITVDDGVGDTVRDLSRLFQKRGWPATFYLSTNYIEGGDMAFLWWRSFSPLLPRKKLVLKNREIDLSSPGALGRLFKTMERLWHSGRLESYVPLTMELAELAAREHGCSTNEIRPPAPISWPEVVQLSKDPLISFESHGVSHVAMSALTDSELQSEMKNSRDLIAGYTGRPCRHFAYPFGSDLSIGLNAVRMAQRFYDSAVAMNLGHIDSANPWLLPRIPLYNKNTDWIARLKLFSAYARPRNQHHSYHVVPAMIEQVNESWSEASRTRALVEQTTIQPAASRSAYVTSGTPTEGA